MFVDNLKNAEEVTLDFNMAGDYLDVGITPDTCQPDIVTVLRFLPGDFLTIPRQALEWMYLRHPAGYDAFRKQARVAVPLIQ